MYIVDVRKTDSFLTAASSMRIIIIIVVVVIVATHKIYTEYAVVSRPLVFGRS